MSDIQDEPAPPREDAVARLNFAVDQLGRYRSGVAELHALVGRSFDAILRRAD